MRRLVGRKGRRGKRPGPGAQRPIPPRRGLRERARRSGRLPKTGHSFVRPRSRARRAWRWRAGCVDREAREQRVNAQPGKRGAPGRLLHAYPLRDRRERRRERPDPPSTVAGPRQEDAALAADARVDAGMIGNAASELPGLPIAGDDQVTSAGWGRRLRRDGLVGGDPGKGLIIPEATPAALLVEIDDDKPWLDPPTDLGVRPTCPTIDELATRVGCPCESLLALAAPRRVAGEDLQAGVGVGERPINRLAVAAAEHDRIRPPRCCP